MCEQESATSVAGSVASQVEQAPRLSLRSRDVRVETR